MVYQGYNVIRTPLRKWLIIIYHFSLNKNPLSNKRPSPNKHPPLGHNVKEAPSSPSTWLLEIVGIQEECNNLYIIDEDDFNDDEVININIHTNTLV